MKKTLLFIVLQTSICAIIAISGNNQCFAQIIKNLTINQSPLLEDSISGTNATCGNGNDGAADLTVSGGTLPYTYNWSPGSDTTEDISGLLAGTYFVLVTDAIGCTASDTITISSLSTAISTTINGFPESNCAGNGAALLTVSGGTPPYTYNWSNGDTTVNINGLSTGTYTVSVTDSIGCIANDTVIIGGPAPPATGITGTDETGCGANDGFATLTVSGGAAPYTFIWSNGSTAQNISGLTVGTYTVVVTDSNGCSAYDTVIINPPVSPTVNITGFDETGCGTNDGFATLTVSGGAAPYTFNWSNGSTAQNITGLAVGTYAVVVTDSNGCSAYDTVIINPPGSPTVNITGFDETVCEANDGQAFAVVTGGASPYTYIWSNGAILPNITGLAPGIYVLDVTDDNNCTASDAVTIIEAPGPQITSMTAIDESSCGANDGVVAINVTGGASPYTFIWSNGATSQNITGLSGGTYSVIVTDNISCTTIDSITLLQQSTLLMTITTTDATCGFATGSATASVTGGITPYSYSWSNGDTIDVADTLISGIYVVTVTDSGGCSVFGAATISDVGGALISVTQNTPATCSGYSNGAIDITVTGGVQPYSYSWSNGSTSQDISNLVAGPYEVNVTDDSGCVATQSITISEPNQLTFNVTEQDAGCSLNNGSATVSVAGGTAPYIYSWPTGGIDSTETGLGAGVYDVIVSDANNCTDQISVSISNISGPVISVDLIADASCGAAIGAIYISVSGGNSPYTFAWSNGDSTQDLTNLQAGIYDVVVTDSTGCLAAESFEIIGAQLQARSICLVTVDSATNTNLIVWEKSGSPLVASYNIYRESNLTDVYYKIGNVPADSLSAFTDSVANPMQRSWKYKISAVDTCGNGSEMSSAHKTMHLNILQAIGNNISLIWDHYEGFSFNYSYDVWRYTATFGWQKLDSLPNYLISYTDFNPPAEDLYYQVRIEHPAGCLPTQNKTLVYNSAKSNVSNRLLPTGINHQSSISNLQFKIYPNPNAGNFTLEIYTPETQNLLINITNILGQIVYSETLNNIKGSYKKQIDLNENPAGIYNLQLISVGRNDIPAKETIINKKIIIE